MIRRYLYVAIFLLVLNTVAQAQPRAFKQAKVSFDDFKKLVTEVEPYRAARLVDLNTFLKMSKEEGTIILDTRSDFRFESIHIQGAKHLSFTDFTQDNLSKVIPTFETRILIYCNNNFDGNQTDFATKLSMPNESAVTSQLSTQAKPIMLALNIPSYINLYGYGYRNVYELNELVHVRDRRIIFDGTVVEEIQDIPVLTKKPTLQGLNK